LKHFFKYLAFWVLILAGCDGEHAEKVIDKGFDYFPLQTGIFLIYDVDETRYDQGNEPEILAYQLKTEVVDSFTNTTGGITYVVYRSTRADENSPWVFLDTWSARVNNTEAVNIEGNISFVKLSFPLAEGIEWNGNMLNNLESDDYEVLSYDVPFTLDGTTFDSTLTIEQEFNDDPIVYTDMRTEVYARDIGLIYKETTQLRFCQAQTCSGNELIETGIIYKQQIREYGVL
jgi:hypothetical protein